ncbi:MAG TPA: periplasmic heavy metal sensor [Vicinamibacterales bacterium]|nr:periplasmic heavy metal sensor [Vicinamibacterales bacterium]
MKFFPRSVAALAAAALFPIVAAAQQPAGQQPAEQQPAGQGRQARQAANRPQLTEQQREQLRTLEEQNRAATQTARRELGDLNRQLNEHLSAAEIDAAKVNALRSAIVQKETALAQQRVDLLAKRASLLTAEQRQAMRGRGQTPGQGAGRMAGPGGRGGAVMQRRPGAQAGRGMQGQRGMIGGGRGMARGEDARLRAELRRLEAQIEALRRRIR